MKLLPQIISENKEAVDDLMVGLPMSEQLFSELLVYYRDVLNSIPSHVLRDESEISLTSWIEIAFHNDTYIDVLEKDISSL